ncbi:MAG: PQQ-binding-like beta-propeller repeat protein [Betaproteobacteria bacterium]|nr:PQQ-binding-like beta-propeller repeat protein [Betaproteobacteria bacterium]
MSAISKPRLMFAAIAVATAQMCSAAGVSTIENAAPGDWPSYHRTYDAHRYSPLTQINRGNVRNLNVAWVHQAGEIAAGLQGTPLAVDGVIYYTASYNRIYAVDGRTGEELWHYFPKILDGVDRLPVGPYSRGVTVANGKLFLGTIDGRAIALDIKTGKPVWEAQLLDTLKCGCMFTSAAARGEGQAHLRLHRRRYPDARGRHLRLKQDSGEKLWYFDPVLEGEEHWGTNSYGESSAKYAGVGAWHVGSYDPDLDLVYWGTSNPSPWFDWAPPGEGPKGYLRENGVVRGPATISTAVRCWRCGRIQANSSGTTRRILTTTGTWMRHSANSS